MIERAKREGRVLLGIYDELQCRGRILLLVKEAIERGLMKMRSEKTLEYYLSLPCSLEIILKILYKRVAENAKKEGINMNQYCMYLLSRNVAFHTAV